MRRLLVLVGLAVGTTISLVAQPSSVEATHVQVYTYVFMPTGSTSPLSEAVLECGWHTNCDAVYGDAMGGLDWRWIVGNPQFLQTRLRIRLLASTASYHVANGRSLNTGGLCPRLNIYFDRISDGGLLGRINHYHSLQGPPGTVYYTWYAANPAVQYDYAVGSMVNPANDDCSSYWHVMQEVIPGSQTNILSKNPNLPTEQVCYHCGFLYPVWSIADALFGFRAQ